MYRLAALMLWTTACEPPPPVELGDDGLPVDDGPSIELLYPEPGQIIALNEACELDEVIVVNVTGLSLVPPNPGELVDGEGHWHGGPNLTAGYCVAFDNACNDYVGTDVQPGLLTLRVELQDNAHGPLGPGDQVEVEIVPPDGVACP